METRPKLRLFRYLVPVVIVLAILFSVRQCGSKQKSRCWDTRVTIYPLPKKEYYV